MGFQWVYSQASRWPGSTWKWVYFHPQYIVSSRATMVYFLFYTFYSWWLILISFCPFFNFDNLFHLRLSTVNKLLGSHPRPHGKKIPSTFYLIFILYLHVKNMMIRRTLGLKFLFRLHTEIHAFISTQTDFIIENVRCTKWRIYSIFSENLHNTKMMITFVRYMQMTSY